MSVCGAVATQCSPARTSSGTHLNSVATSALLYHEAEPGSAGPLRIIVK